MTPRSLRIATAGWAIPRDTAASFATDGTGLQRYAGVFDAVEINSTFKRVHRASTWARWAASVGPDFRFACKFPEAISHQARLVDAQPLVEAFVAQTHELGPRLGPLLLQLPPSLEFDPSVFDGFMRGVEALDAGPIACEPRHASWFTPEVDRRLAGAGVARVAADPVRHPGADAPGGWRELSYYRLHGSPKIYASLYGAERLAELHHRLANDPAPEIWCVFDNTASGAAARDALALRTIALEERS